MVMAMVMVLLLLLVLVLVLVVVPAIGRRRTPRTSHQATRRSNTSRAIARRIAAAHHAARRARERRRAWRHRAKPRSSQTLRRSWARPHRRGSATRSSPRPDTPRAIATKN